MTIKIEAMDGALPQPLAYGNVFAQEEVGGRPRLRVGVDEAQEAAVAALADGLRGPFQLLYVLYTTRIGAELARYESRRADPRYRQRIPAPVWSVSLRGFRHDLWIRSHDDDATIVLDRHNLIADR